MIVIIARRRHPGLSHHKFQNSNGRGPLCDVKSVQFVPSRPAAHLKVVINHTIRDRCCLSIVRSSDYSSLHQELQNIQPQCDPYRLEVRIIAALAKQHDGWRDLVPSHSVSHLRNASGPRGLEERRRDGAVGRDGGRLVVGGVARHGCVSVTSY
ncbi:unnamed protein product [Cercospora beticola]|nr:unnamed protein product [Cercospora beticola]